MDNWQDIDGLACSLGLPELRKLSLSRFCNFIWWAMTHNAKNDAEVARVKATLYQPPPDAEVPAGSPWSAEAEMSAFANLKASLGQ